MLVVNKADLNPEWTDRLEQWAERCADYRLPDAFPYDLAVTGAQVALQTVVEAGEGPAAHAIRAVWNVVFGEAAWSTAGLPVRDFVSCAG
jgi:hypothetical protein